MRTSASNLGSGWKISLPMCLPSNRLPWRYTSSFGSRQNTTVEKMNTVWAQRREEVLRDCIVSPDVFTQMVDRLGEFVVPYQQALETEAGQHPMHLYLQGLL